MTVKINHPDMTPVQALDSIKARLLAAIEKGKQAAAGPKVESIMEATEDAGDNDELNFDFGFEEEPQQGEQDNVPDYGDTPVPVKQPERNQPNAAQRTLKGVMGGDGKAGSVPDAVMTPDKRAELERQANEYLKGWQKFSVAEIKANVLSLFELASQNKQYLASAGPLITEGELRAIFYGEYISYQDKPGLSKATLSALDRVPTLFNEHFSDIMKKFDARLHGEDAAGKNGRKFLEGGSLMAYLIACGHKDVIRTASLEPSRDLALGKEEGICNFILSRDLKKCMEWVGGSMDKHGITGYGKESIALDILANGMNKDDIRAITGGTTKKDYISPRFGSLERRGDNVAVLGGREFLDAFVNQFGQFLAMVDAEPMYPDTQKATTRTGSKGRTGLYMVLYPEKPYLEYIQEFRRHGAIVPISFNAGTVSLDKGGSADSNDAGRVSDILQGHATDTGLVGNGQPVSERLTINNLVNRMEHPAFKSLAAKCGLESELDAILKMGESLSPTSLSKFTAALLMKLAEKSGVSPKVVENHSYAYVDIPGEGALVHRISAGLSSQEQSALRTVGIFNDMVKSRLNAAKDTRDVGDITGMSAAERNSLLVPEINIGNLARECFSDDASKEMLDIARGYMINALGTAVGFDGSDAQIVGSARDFGGTDMNSRIIMTELARITPDKLPAYADSFSDKAAEHWRLVQESAKNSGRDEGGDFFDDTKTVPVTALGDTSLAKAMHFYDKNGNPVSEIKSVIENIAGFEPGFIDGYIKALKEDNGAVLAEKASEIKKYGRGIINVKLTDNSTERVNRVTEDPTKKAQKRAKLKSQLKGWM